jgi:hypothetical protein
MALSREQMEEVIKGGGSVLVSVGGRKKLVSSVANLPSQAELAKTDAEKSVAAADIDSQIAALQAQKSGLIGNQPGGGESDSTNANSQKGNAANNSIDDSIEELMKHTRAELVEKAKDVGVEVGDTDTKTQISEAILKRRTERESE